MVDTDRPPDLATQAAAPEAPPAVREPPGPSTLGVLVVHGIGGPRPAEALVELTDALQSAGYIAQRGDLSDSRRRSGLNPDQTDSPLEQRRYHTGPLPVMDSRGYHKRADGTADTNDLRPIRFAEVFWADITQLPGGIAGVLSGYFDIFFNLRTLITSAVPAPADKEPDLVAAVREAENFTERQEPGRPTPQWIHKVDALRDGQKRPFTLLTGRAASLSCKLIAGPIACANLLLFLLFLSLWILAPIFGLGRAPADTLPPLMAPSATFLAIAILLLIGALARRQVKAVSKPRRLGAKPKVLAWFTGSAFVLAGLATFEWIAIHHEWIAIQLGIGGSGLFEVLSSQWARMPFVEGLATWLPTTGLLPYREVPIPALVPSVLIYLLGGLILPILLIFFSATFLIRAAWHFVSRRSESEPGMNVALLAPMLQATLWMIAIPEAWRLLAMIYPPELFQGLHKLIPCLMAGPLGGAATTGGFQWEGLQAFTTLAFVVAVIVFWAYRWIRGSTLRAILATPIGVALSVLVAIGGLHGMLNVLADLQVALPFDLGPYAGAVDEWLANFGVLKFSPAILAFVISLGSDSIRQGLSLADDVVTYLEFNGAEARPKEVKIARGGEQGIDEEMAALERRRPIRHCFSHALNHLLQDQDVASLLIVSHSQGTVIALDEIVEANPEHDDGFYNRSGKRVSVSWVTMGSPIHHLYQHYFPACYPAFADPDARPGDGRSVVLHPYWHRLAKRVDRWTNIYRPDDFVGTRMGFKDDCTLAWREGQQGTSFREFAIGKGGHTHYWSDSDALQHIGALLEKLGFAAREPHLHTRATSEPPYTPV